jgi:hypothetical protein
MDMNNQDRVRDYRERTDMLLRLDRLERWVTNLANELPSILHRLDALETQPDAPNDAPHTDSCLCDDCVTADPSRMEGLTIDEPRNNRLTETMREPDRVHTGVVQMKTTLNEKLAKWLEKRATILRLKQKRKEALVDGDKELAAVNAACIRFIKGT